MDDTSQVREDLTRSWRAVIDFAIERGSPPNAVVETMAAVAHERFADLFGNGAAANYLRLLAEQIQQADREATTALVTGQEPDDHDLPRASIGDPTWPERWKDDLI